MSAFPVLDIAVPRVAGAEAKTWDQKTIEWSEILGWLTEPADVKEAGGYVLGVLRDGRRSADTVVSRCALTLDADYPEPGLIEAVKALGCTLAWHSTYRASLAKPRYRIIIPLERDVTPAEYEVIADGLMARLGVEQFDRGSRQPERFMFRPGTSDPLAYEHGHTDGPLFSVEDALLVAAAPAPRVNRTKRDPLTLEGIVGDFNRAYEDDWQALIDAYELPYVAARGERWALAGTHGAAGMGPVRNARGIVYSHHENDPAYDTACSAFDLVRLHRHGELDAGAAPKTPITRLPSYAAMLTTAAGDERLLTQQRERLQADFSAIEKAAALPEDSPAAKAAQAPAQRLPQLTRGRNGVEPTVQNRDEVSQHDPLFRQLRFNEMTLSVELAGGAAIPGPLVEGQPTIYRRMPECGDSLDKGDLTAIRDYVARIYDMPLSTQACEELVNVTAMRAGHRYSPVRDYLEALEWDGVSRVETCLPGVEVTDYSRLVARKVMCAAAARALEPGIKWDHMLVLYGTEGLGKTYWIEKMARGFSAALGRIGDKDTLLTLLRSWIMTSDESASLKQAEFDAQKEFLTRTSDTFRAPYDPRPMQHPRHCVIWGTTNDPVFLRRQEGNRRFLIVHVEQQVDFDTLTDEYVDQVWAEAVHLWRAGERLYLNAEEGALAAAHRELFTEEDAMTGQLGHYLDTLVPAGWADMPLADRQGWLAHRGDDLAAAGTESIDAVSSLQLWVEALGNRPGDYTRADLLRVGAAMRLLSGWYFDTRVVETKLYGKQRLFRRIASDPLI